MPVVVGAEVLRLSASVCMKQQSKPKVKGSVRRPFPPQFCSDSPPPPRERGGERGGESVYFSAVGAAAAPPGLIENCSDREKEEGMKKVKEERKEGRMHHQLLLWVS